MNDLYIAILSIIALILICVLAYIIERYNKLEGLIANIKYAYF